MFYFRTRNDGRLGRGGRVYRRHQHTNIRNRSAEQTEFDYGKRKIETVRANCRDDRRWRQGQEGLGLRMQHLFGRRVRRSHLHVRASLLLALSSSVAGNQVGILFRSLIRICNFRCCSLAKTNNFLKWIVALDKNFDYTKITYTIGLY